MLDGAPVMMRPGLHVGNLGGVLSLGIDLGSIICQTCVTMSGSLRKSLESLPNFSLNAGGETTTRFLAAGVADFHSAARYVQRLPYGRNSDSADFQLVLRERRGKNGWLIPALLGAGTGKKFGKSERSALRP